MAERVGRGSLTGRWEPRPGAHLNIRGGISIERDLPAGTKLWFTGWTKAISGREVVSVLVEIAWYVRALIAAAAGSPEHLRQAKRRLIRNDLLRGPSRINPTGAAGRSGSWPTGH